MLIMCFLFTILTMIIVYLYMNLKNIHNVKNVFLIHHFNYDNNIF